MIQSQQSTSIGNLASLFFFRKFLAVPLEPCFLLDQIFLSVGFKSRIDTEISAHVIAKFIQKQKHVETNLLNLHGITSHQISSGVICLLVEI